MWASAQATATAVVIGAALIAAGAHGTGRPPADEPAAVVTYRPPTTALPDTAQAPAHVLPPRPPRHRAAVRRHPAAPLAAASAPTRTRTPTARPARRRAQPVARPQSFTAALDGAIARIPTYRAGAARWVVSSKYDFWGTADWYHDVLYVSPDVPQDKLYDVAVHEWSHELSVLDYGGDVDAATKAMNAWFGGSDLTGAERAADCMAILQGATWTHYTTCNDTHWRAGARRLIAGNRL